MGKITGWDPKESGKINCVLAELSVAHFGEAWSGEREFILVKYVRSQFGCNPLRFLKTLSFH